jgi:hypothetical protein
MMIYFASVIMSFWDFLLWVFEMIFIIVF